MSHSNRLRFKFLFWAGVLVLTVPLRHSLAQDGTPPDPKKDASLQAAIDALGPLFQQIKNAKSTRASVDLSADTVIDGAVINSQVSVYQIASQTPGQFTVYLKDDKQRTRIYCDGKSATIALSETAYTELEEPIAMQEAVFQLPIPMGPYPEPVMALTLAGVDPELSLTNGMKTVRIVDKKPFRGETPAIHFEGIQEDDVKWELWITQDAMPKPLRLRVDLTEMLRANGTLELSAGYRYTLRFDFKTWRIDHPNDASLFRYTKIKNAQEYESVEAYYRQAQAKEAETR